MKEKKRFSLKKIIVDNSKFLLASFIGAIIGSAVVGYAANIIYSGSQVGYDNSTSRLNSNDVQAALDELFSVADVSDRVSALESTSTSIGNRVSEIENKVMIGNDKMLFAINSSGYPYLRWVTNSSTNASKQVIFNNSGTKLESTTNGTSFTTDWVNNWVSTTAAASTDTIVQLPTSSNYLVIVGHNSTAACNGMYLVRPGGNIAWNLTSNLGGNITMTVNSTNLTIRPNGCSVNVFYSRLN